MNANFLRQTEDRKVNLDVDYADYLLSSPGTFHLRSSSQEELPTEIRVDRNTPLQLWTFKGDITQHFGDGHSIELAEKPV